MDEEQKNPVNAPPETAADTAGVRDAQDTPDATVTNGAPGTDSVRGTRDAQSARAQNAAGPDADTAAEDEAPTEDEPTAEDETGTAAEDAPSSRAERKKDKKLKAEAALEAAKAELAKTKELFMRTAAEYDNYRKRTTRERDAAFGNGVAHAAEKVLPLIDTLEMAAAAETADENYKKGVQMTLTKAYAVLRDLGLEEIPAEGQPFDPAVHAAVQQQAAEGVAPGTVVQVYQKGYTLHGKVVRHAMVVVSA